MKLQYAVFFVAACLAAPCAIAGKPYAVTPSGKPEANFSGSAQDASGALASKCMDAQWTVVKSSPQEVVCEAPLTTGRQMVAQMLMGNAYSTPPRRFFRFNIVEAGGIARVQPSGWVETQMAFGQVQRVDFNNAEFHNSIMNFLANAGGKPPIGTSFPNHAFIGAGKDSAWERNGKYLAVRINSVMPDTPAARAGLQPGDLVTKIAGRSFKDDNEQLETLEKAAQSPTYNIEVLRNSEKLTLAVDREFRPSITESAAPKLTTPAVAASNPPQSVADELSKLVKLREQGILSDAEFEAQKKKLLL